MGTDKSQLLIHGESFVQRIANIVLEVASTVTVVGRAADNEGLKVALDVYPGWGALGGLHAALQECGSDWAFVVACDLPFITSDLISRLADARDKYDAVIPIQPDKRPQPLCSFYRKDPCLRQATELIEIGKRRPLDLLERVNTRWVSFTELEDLEQSDKFFLNINTPEDYYEATRKTASDNASHHHRP